MLLSKAAWEAVGTLVTVVLGDIVAWKVSDLKINTSTRSETVTSII